MNNLIIIIDNNLISIVKKNKKKSVSIHIYTHYTNSVNIVYIQITMYKNISNNIFLLLLISFNVKIE